MGFASLFMDTSSELIHALVPVFLVSVLGASAVAVGVIEGIAEGTAAVTKVFSGALSDFLRRRKALMVFGYALAAFTKPVFPLAPSVGWVFAARFVDRIGKGIRGAPRDALLAEIAPPPLRGAAFGLRQSLDSVGAFAGPLLGVLLLGAWAFDVRTAMWVAVVPAILCVLLLVVFVREPEPRGAADSAGGKASPRVPLRFADAKRLPGRYWAVVALGAVFTLARFSEAFLVLRAQDVGLELAYVPGVLVAMNVVYALGAYPAGAASDRMRARTLLLTGLVALIAADAVLAVASTAPVVLAGAGLWGLHMALTQGLLSKLVADASPEDLRGTAFGLFNLVAGGALLLASVIAGFLWEHFGPAATFVAGGGFAALAAAGLLAGGGLAGRFRQRPGAG
jgi:MFS family permease